MSGEAFRMKRRAINGIHTSDKSLENDERTVVVNVEENLRVKIHMGLLMLMIAILFV